MPSTEGLCPDLPFIQAAHFYRDRRGAEAELLVLHITQGWGNELRLGKYFQNEHVEASAHLGVGRFGGAAQYVAADHAAWHVGGKGRDWNGRGNINRRSFGVELCNRGPVKRKVTLRRKYQKKAPWGFTEAKHPKGSKLRFWENFPKRQLDTLFDLIPWILSEHPSIRYVTSHEDVSRGKLDPGPLFPWHLIPWDDVGLIRMEHDWSEDQWYEWRGHKRTLYVPDAA